jgi:hypothetical protein
MYKVEILSNVFKTFLESRINPLEKSCTEHTDQILQSFKILNEIKQTAAKMNTSLNELIANTSKPSLTPSNSKREINKSFTSNTNSKTLTKNKSRVFEKKNEKSKTPVKRQTDKSLGKSFERQKSEIFKSNDGVISNANKKMNINKNLTINKFTIFKKEDTDTNIKRGRENYLNLIQIFLPFRS